VEEVRPGEVGDPRAAAAAGARLVTAATRSVLDSIRDAERAPAGDVAAVAEAAALEQCKKLVREMRREKRI